MAAYSKMNFGMFGGTPQMVKLCFKNEMVGVIIDRFGKDMTIKNSDIEGFSETNVEVAVSDQFFGWLFGLGNAVRIAGPEDVVSRYKKELEQAMALY